MPPRYTSAKALASSKASSRDASGVFERGDVLVVVVADGGGGMRGGEAASRRLATVVEAAVTNPAFPLESIQEWVDLFQTTDAGIAERRSGETTGVVVVVSPRRLIGLSTGDSEAWLVTPSRVDLLTGSQHTAERLGTNSTVPTIFERPPLAGTLLVASDGLFKFAAVGVIADIVRKGDAAAAAEALVGLVRLRSGRVAEDVDVVVVRPL